MAALMRHALFKTSRRFAAAPNIAQGYATKTRRPNPDKKPTPRIDSTAKSLAAKGFLRAQNAYTPPRDLPARFAAICNAVLGGETVKIVDVNQRYALLNGCFQEFNHSVPNSLLHTMQTTDDVLQFYKTPIDTTIPLDMMKNMDLPKNLHIQYEYNRFHPETDTMFEGVTAYPRSSTLVTGLTTRKKYRGHEARTTWPYNT